MAEDVQIPETQYEAAKDVSAAPSEQHTVPETAHMSKLAALEAWVKGEFAKLKAEFIKTKNEL